MKLNLRKIAIVFVVVMSLTCCANASIEIGIAAFGPWGMPAKEEINAFEQDLGKHISTFNWFLGFADSYQSDIPSLYLNTSIKYHDGYQTDIIPMLTLEPWVLQQDVVDGKYDSYLSRLATQLNSYGSTTRLRYGHEMIQDDNPATAGFYSWQDQPTQYVEAFRHVYDVMKPLAPQMEFVWSPNQTPNGVDLLAKYFPGTAYTDWIGLDGYSWDGNYSFDAIFKDIYHDIADHPEIFGDKPFMIAEFASGEGVNKPAWIRDAFAKMQTDYERIQAFYWFNVNKERDWRVDSSPEAFEAFKLAMQDKAFISHVPDVTVTPEPVSSALFLLGGGAMAWRLRGRKKEAAV